MLSHPGAFCVSRTATLLPKIKDSPSTASESHTSTTIELMINPRLFTGVVSFV